MKASTHQRLLAITLTKPYGITQIWGELGAPVAAEAQREAFTSMKRYVLLSRDRYLRDKTSLEDVATPDSLLRNPPIVELSTRCSKI